MLVTCNPFPWSHMQQCHITCLRLLFSYNQQIWLISGLVSRSLQLVFFPEKLSIRGNKLRKGSESACCVWLDTNIVNK